MSISSVVVSGERSASGEGGRSASPLPSTRPLTAPARGSVQRFTFAAGLACMAIFLGVLVASFPVAELAFRLLGDEPSADLRGLYTNFANNNYKLAPNVQTGARFASGPLSVYTDKFGFRCDKERQFAADTGAAIDILLIGDSQGFGNGVNFEDTIGGTMAALAAGEGFRVSNASVGGHSLASQLQLARWLVDEQELRVANYVVLLTPAMIHAAEKVNQAAVGEDGRLYGELTTGARLRVWAKSNSVVYSKIRDAIRNLGIGADPTQGSSTVFAMYDATHGQTEAEAGLLRTLEEFKAFAGTHGAALHTVYVPLTVEANFDSVREAAAKQNQSLDPDASFRVAASVAERLRVPLYDLRPALQQTHAAGEVLIVKGDFHYSPLLSRAAGARLWTELGLTAKPHTQ